MAMVLILVRVDLIKDSKSLYVLRSCLMESM